MFDVLVYLYENYWRPDACPDHEQLTRKLSAVGFETDEIQEALSWLDGLTATTALAQIRMPMPQDIDCDAANEVEIFSTFQIVDHRTPAPHDRNRLAGIGLHQVLGGGFS